MTVETSSMSEEERKAAEVEANKDPREQATRDPKPRKRGGKRPGAGRPKGAANKSKETKAKPKVSDAAIQSALSQLLVSPAIPCSMIPEDESREFLTMHFMGLGPVTAERLVELSHQSPELRALLEKLTGTSLIGGLAMLSIAYAAPPALWAFGMRPAAQAIESYAGLTPEKLAEIKLEAARQEEQLADEQRYYAEQEAAPQGPMIYSDGAQTQAQDADPAFAAAAALAAARRAQAPPSPPSF
jgi:hypothetical protein